MLLALTSAGRSSDFQKLDINFMNMQDDEIVFTIVKLPKKSETGSLPHNVTFKSFYENDNLDVRKCLLSYIDSTVSIRDVDSGQLLISFVKPHNQSKSKKNGMGECVKKDFWVILGLLDYLIFFNEREFLMLISLSDFVVRNFWPLYK